MMVEKGIGRLCFRLHRLSYCHRPRYVSHLVDKLVRTVRHERFSCLLCASPCIPEFSWQL